MKIFRMCYVIKLIGLLEKSIKKLKSSFFMVKIVFCDKCNKEIKRYDDNDPFSDFGNHSDIWDSVNETEITPNTEIVKITKPQLCKSCRLKFNDLMKKFNQEISSFLKERKSKETKIKSVKKRNSPKVKKKKRTGLFRT